MTSGNAAAVDAPQDDTDEGPALDEGTTPRGRLVVVMGAKGGCGTTWVACHLAASLAADQHVCLVDLDQCKGDVATVLDLPAGRDLNPLLDHVGPLDEALLRGTVSVHESGLRVLAQPYDLHELHQLTAEDVRRILDLACAHHAMVVVDAGNRVDVASLAAALSADDIVLVTTGHVSALRDAHRVRELLARLEVSLDRVRLVVNHHGAPGTVSVADIAAQLHTEVAATVARGEGPCVRADAAGKLLFEVAPHAVVTRDLASLWSRLDRPDTPPLRTWFWARR